MEESRIESLRNYMFNVMDTLVTDTKYQINADFLGDVGDFSLDKIPTETQAELPWIIGVKIKKDVYSLRGRKYYSQDTINNLKNIGFFEKFENKIEFNNNEHILPDIDGIESIECLNCGTLNNVDGTKATFDIQIQVKYRKDEEVQASL